MKQRNLWPLAIILTFLVFIGGTTGLIILAATRTSDLISPDYYEHELKFQSHLDSLKRANHLTPRVVVKYEAVLGHIRVSIPPQQAGASGTIELYRPSAARLDQSFPLKPDTNGTQWLDAAKLKPGLWKVRVTWKVAGEEFCVEEKTVIGPGNQKPEPAWAGSLSHRN